MQRAINFERKSSLARCYLSFSQMMLNDTEFVLKVIVIPALEKVYG